MKTESSLAFLLLLGASLATAPALAVESDGHTWITPAPLLEKHEYFANLADGATITTPFLLKFGLTGMGLASINGVAEGAGHHHPLVNRELPLDFTQPLPFNSQYIHFGKGQMETVLNFEPGQYTLRLVLADNRHIPDFVYSKPIHVTVARHDATVDPKKLSKQEIAILSPAAGARLHPPFRVGFHASGFNVSSVAVPDAGSGHFRLVLERDGDKGDVMEFENGHTEVWLTPPVGHYVAQLYLVDNRAHENLLAKSERISFDVVR